VQNKKQVIGGFVLAKHKAISTKLEIVKTATRLIWEKGYTAMSTRMVAAELDISVGNITYYYPSKDDLLSILVNSLCKFQRKFIEDVAEDGISSVMAVCLELMTMTSACESNPIAKDFFISSYQSPMTLKIIRENDTERSKEVYKEYCKRWTDEQFAEAEVLVSGIEYATLMSLDEDIPLETRIAEALDKILYVYNVPKKIRETKIKKALSYDYKHIGERIFKEFKEYVDKTTEETFEQILIDAEKATGRQSPAASFE
jgi:AcrR family transcriptional regulator